ncbi:hypothetical protein SKAU_G00333230 [Synaphobranchus kaupii]|uniref:Ig-like domain-containing protein n=1 Tax=Synaphobranchus kaupii TaxID=118154 RepID=A0A9Q1ELQ4_SYNKA|nr:hypothetical protein SKAU_G00333230 [Synaphobranchus kaupii]
MARAYLFSPAVGYLSLLLWAVRTAVAVETSGRVTVSQYPPVVTVTRGQSAVLPCHFSRGSVNRNYRVLWYKTRGADGVRTTISSLDLPPRFSYAEDKASLLITPVAVEDVGVYYCTVKTLGSSAYEGNSTELRVLAPPSAPQLFLQVPLDLWSGQWNMFCVTGGFYPNRVRLSWTVNGAMTKLQDCTPESADPGPVQSNGPVWQNLTLKENPDSAPNGWLPVSLVMESKLRPHQRCVHVTDSCGQGPYLLSVFPLPFGPVAGVTYTCTVHDHPALPTVLFTSLSWELPSSKVIRCLNIVKMCFLSGATLAFTVAALNWRLKQREAHHPLPQAP